MRLAAGFASFRLPRKKSSRTGRSLIDAMHLRFGSACVVEKSSTAMEGLRTTKSVGPLVAENGHSPRSNVFVRMPGGPTPEVTMSNDFIATRRLELAGESPGEVIVGIKRPVPDDGPYRCEYQIVGIGSGTVRYAMGEDSMQALVLTLQTIGADLYTSEAAKEGRLTWFGSPNLGFPVPDIIADLVPKDSHPVGIHFDFRYAPGEWHRNIDCGNWDNAREAAIAVATRKKVEWVEIHAHEGAKETWRYSNGKWEQV